MRLPPDLQSREHSGSTFPSTRCSGRCRAGGGRPAVPHERVGGGSGSEAVSPLQADATAARWCPTVTSCPRRAWPSPRATGRRQRRAWGVGTRDASRSNGPPARRIVLVDRPLPQPAGVRCPTMDGSRSQSRPRHTVARDSVAGVSGPRGPAAAHRVDRGPEADGRCDVSERIA